MGHTRLCRFRPPPHESFPFLTKQPLFNNVGTGERSFKVPAIGRGQTFWACARPTGGAMQEFDPHVLEEKPIPPPEDFSKKARVKSLKEYQEIYQKAADSPEEFWGEQSKLLHWFQTPKKVLEWNLPHAKWFSGGKLNVSYNCLDRHLELNANKPALMWEGEDGS